MLAGIVSCVCVMHQHIIRSPRQVDGGVNQDGNVRIVLRIIDQALNSADVQARGIHTVAAHGDNLFAGVDTFIRKNVDDFRLAGSIAAQNAAQPRLS